MHYLTCVDSRPLVSVSRPMLIFGLFGNVVLYYINWLQESTFYKSGAKWGTLTKKP